MPKSENTESGRNNPGYTDSDIVTLKDICLKRGYRTILDRVSLSIRPGEIHALLGRKGSGKSPIGKIINGNIKPDSGQILYFGRNRKSYGSEDLTF
jgi:ABC-type multidrug transport system ATPase subunit